VAVLTNQSLLTTGRYDLLVLPGARALPMEAAPAVKSYLQEGGDLWALGLPAWESPLFLLQGHWLSREGYEGAVTAQRRFSPAEATKFWVGLALSHTVMKRGVFLSEGGCGFIENWVLRSGHW